MGQPHEIPVDGAAATFAANLRNLMPVLETERLTLRAPELTDFDALFEIAASEQATGIGGPMSREDAWNEFTQMTATWVWRGHGYWTVTDRADNNVLGFVGIGFEPGDQEPELGYFFRADAQGHGYASEAASAVIGHARSALKMSSLISYIYPSNTRSIAVAKRLGAVRDPSAEAAVAHLDTIQAYRHNLEAAQ